MTVVAVQVLISSSALSCELNQMFCIKIVIWQLTSKEEEESLSHAIKQQPRETGSLHSAITEDQPHVLVAATTVRRAESASSSSETCWIYSHDMMKSPKLETLTSMQQRFYKRASVLFAHVRFKSGHYWSSDTTADQKNSKSPIC